MKLLMPCSSFTNQIAPFRQVTPYLHHEYPTASNTARILMIVLVP